MANIQALQEFAAQHAFGLTSPLSPRQVEVLAKYWLPTLHFYWKEKFHPIALDDIIAMVEEQYAQMPDPVQEHWKVAKVVRKGNGTKGEKKRFDPPVVYIPDGNVQLPGQQHFIPAIRVLNDSTPTRDAMAAEEVRKKAAISHGATFTRADQFFGGNKTVFGGNVPKPGDPLVPRAVNESEDPQVTVFASYKNLFETLKYELLVESDDTYPPDALRGGFDIVLSLFREGFNAGPFQRKKMREVLLELIAAHETNQPITDALNALPFGWSFDKRAWDAVTRYGFLEFHFIYAYNDFDRYQTTPFENEHEGDDEGCCLVFDRNVINLAAADLTKPEEMKKAVPHCIITSVHEEWQNADKFCLISPPLNTDPNTLPRDDMELAVYVAGGSHATYLKPGDHDIVDFQDSISGIANKAPWLFMVPAVPLAVAILVSIIDHFVDTEDKTSVDGIHSGSPDVATDEVRAVDTQVVMIPMSAEQNIYQAEHEELLKLVAFPGKWGGHDGLIDQSPPFTAKTGRYFRKLLRNL